MCSDDIDRHLGKQDMIHISYYFVIKRMVTYEKMVNSQNTFFVHRLIPEVLLCQVKFKCDFVDSCFLTVTIRTISHLPAKTVYASALPQWQAYCTISPCQSALFQYQCTSEHRQPCHSILVHQVPFLILFSGHICFI